ncbi:hypothetical protein C7E25_23740, partial [Stenotrophomonas maltophilia]
MQGREPGAVGAALEDRDSWIGIIVDGVHVHAGLDAGVRGFTHLYKRDVAACRAVSPVRWALRWKTATAGSASLSMACMC